MKIFPKANASLCHEIVVEPFAASRKMDAGPVELRGQGGFRPPPPKKIKLNFFYRTKLNLCAFRILEKVGLF